MKRNTIAGLHLWNVKAKYKVGDWVKTVGLFVTTKNKSWKLAMQKGETVLRERTAEFPNAKIEGLEYNGTLDA